MFERLLRLARLAAWASTGITIVYIAADARGVNISHEGAVWVITAVSWALFMELKGRDAMCYKVNAEVIKIQEGMSDRMDEYERHTIGHTVAAERTIGCQPGTTGH